MKTKCEQVKKGGIMPCNVEYNMWNNVEF